MSNTKIFLAIVIALAIGLKFPLLSAIVLPILCVFILIGLSKSIGYVFKSLARLFK